MPFRGEVWTYVLVTVVTLLVWIWAAGKTRDQTTLSASIRFAPPSEAEYLASPAELPVKVTVVGSSQALRNAEDRLRNPLSVPVVPEPGSRSVTIELDQAIAERPELARTGVEIIAVDPPSIIVQVDQVVHVTAAVRPALGDVRTEGPIEIDPPQVDVAMPSVLRAQYAETLIAEAYVEPSRLARLEHGERHTLEAPLRLADWRGAAGSLVFNPPVVRVTFTPRSRLEQITLDVRVQVLSPPEDSGEYVVELAESSKVIPAVTIEAESDLVRRIRSGEVKVVAVVQLSTRDKEQRIESKPVTCVLALRSDAPGLLGATTVAATIAGSREPPVVQLRILERTSEQGS
jgi:hypothetical protein